MAAAQSPAQTAAGCHQSQSPSPPTRQSAQEAKQQGLEQVTQGGRLAPQRCCAERAANRQLWFAPDQHKLLCEARLDRQKPTSILSPTILQSFTAMGAALAASWWLSFTSCNSQLALRRVNENQPAGTQLNTHECQLKPTSYHSGKQVQKRSALYTHTSPQSCKTAPSSPWHSPQLRACTHYVHY